MDIQKFVGTNEDGTIKIDKDGFQSALDAEISKAVEKFKNGKGRDEIRKQLEEEAKLSAEEKLKQERDEFEKYKLQARIELNQSKAKARLEGKGFTEKETSFILSTVGDDEEKSLASIDELIKEREQVIANTKKTAIEGLQSGQRKSQSVITNPDGNDGNKQPFQWSQSDILNHYRPQNKNN